ncbi:unnamed protein product [Fusarium graminearum]|uniref:Uncharacterized protein n=1 Tax=Gibberella zeae TaxID=5518 RepID=A0A4E9EEH0_GIBZA|nr:unnamed protein product [Fusarium graminearum]CAG1991469.1 unnamed protein product [Fusarium graminearum]
MVGEGARNRDEDLQLEIMDKGELQVAMIKRVTSVDEMPAICKEENPSVEKTTLTRVSPPLVPVFRAGWNAVSFEKERMKCPAPKDPWLIFLSHRLCTAIHGVVSKQDIAGAIARLGRKPVVKR